MPEWLTNIDQALFMILNGWHCALLDPVMSYGTKTLTWLPFYLVLLIFVIRRYHWRTLWVMLFAACMVLTSDQLSNLVKDWVARPRPTHEPALTGIHTVNGYLGATFGFYSAHASNNLALAVFLIRVLGSPFRFFPAMMLLYAFFMAWTRIYLGVHYPGDIVAGWIAGGLIGWGFGSLCRWYTGRE